MGVDLETRNSLKQKQAMAHYYYYYYYYFYCIRYTSVIAIDSLSLNIWVQTMDFGRAQRGFLLDGEDLPGKVGCRKESYFLELMLPGILLE